MWESIVVCYGNVNSWVDWVRECCKLVIRGKKLRFLFG